jgi:eukaryotic-like serine/threonine-protein kinase
MGPRAEFGQRIRFGEFQLDPGTRELWRNGQKFSIQEQPFQILSTLLERPGQLISREELRKRLWSSSTFVDFEHGLNKAMNRLREVLEDSADQPRFIETLPRRGYRFIAPVDRLQNQAADLQEEVAEPNVRVQSTSAPGSLAGKKVSHYRVLDILGGGGMGLIYRAEDLKLGRRVALKFLPDELWADAKALERFEREARAASALDHPNICAIHEFGEHEGQPFMVMPLLEGQTLRDRIAVRGSPLATDEILSLAIQITDALETAHQKGIIHRDIKPANIFITTRGEPKILDFGLAKLTGDPEAVRYQEAPTGLSTHLSLTRTGVALGTAAYMSPEQVRGEKLDARTDLFSFGLVLYEMATGQQAFSGETAAVLHEAILNRMPAPARDSNPELPVGLEQIINKALKKDREQRYQSAAQMGTDLESLKRETEPMRRGARWPLVAAGVFAMFLAVGATLLFKNRQPSVQAELPELRQRQLTSNSSENAVASGAISPDGRYLAYADLNGIHIKLIETGETKNVPQPDDFKGLQVDWGIISTWVDGGRFIANAIVPGHRSSVWLIPAMGGAPHKLRDDAFAGSVSRDGSWVAFATKPGRVDYSEMWLMRPDGQQARKLWEADENTGFEGTEWSPDGRRLSYALTHHVAGGIERAIESRDLTGGPATVAIPVSGWDWSWLPDGRMIHISGERGQAVTASDSCNFWAIPIDTRTGKPLDKPKRLTNWAGFCMDAPSPTADAKRLSFRRWSWQGSVYVADLEANGTRMTSPRHLTLNEGRNYPSAWTADSQAVVFESYRDGRWMAFKQRLNEDAVQPISTGLDEDTVDARVSPDGAWVLYIRLPALNQRSTSPSTALVPVTKSRLEEADAATLRELMRVSTTGGLPQLVLTTSAPTYAGLRCAKAPATLCALAERTIDHKQLVFTAFDPVRGRGRELTRFDIDPADEATYVWDLSPDGTRVAILKYSEGRIRVLSWSRRQASQEILVKGWNNLQSLDWAADGKGLFASSLRAGSSALLHLDLQGNAHLLWEQKGSTSPAPHPWDRPFAGPSASWAVPSPDGRHLAIYQWSVSSNMWMMENF